MLPVPGHLLPSPIQVMTVLRSRQDSGLVLVYGTVAPHPILYVHALERTGNDEVQNGRRAK